MKSVIRAFSIGLAVAISFIFVGMALFHWGPKIESVLYPVVSNVKVAPVEIDLTRSIVHIVAYGAKVRHCEWQGITALVERNNMWYQGKVHFADPRTGSPESATTARAESRPAGTQSFGEIFIFPAGDRIQVFLYHRCHPLWQTTTFIYELDLNENPAQSVKGKRYDAL